MDFSVHVRFPIFTFTFSAALFYHMRRSQALDILRAAAIALVLGRHMKSCPQETNKLFFYLTSLWTRVGWIGVDIFFVISGFLVSGLLFKEHQKYGSVSIKNFLIRRGFKIYPSLYFLVLVTVLVRFLGNERIDLPDVLRELFFLQNYGGGLWGHTWSLAVEEHFYLLLSLIVAVSLGINKAAKNPFSFLPGLFALVALLCLSLRIYTTRVFPYAHETNVYPTHLRIDSLLFGVLISYFYHYRKEVFAGLVLRYRKLMWIAGILCFVPFFVLALGKSLFVPTFGFVLLYLGSGLILCVLIDHELRPTAWVRAICFIGAHSYPIYLWHIAWKVWIVQRIIPIRTLENGFNWYIYAGLYLSGAILVGIIMSYLVETPMLKLRDRLYPSRSSLPITQPAV
jgi:peptidoglycan/LPS O-acetylase OafA/YrhL